MSTPTRSFGVTILVVLQILVGVLTFLGGVAALFIRMLLPETFPQIRPFPMTLFTTGIVFMVFAVVDFGIAYGLWMGKKWAWVLSLLFSAFGIISAIFSLFLRPRTGEFLALVMDLAIVFYLIQPRVQAYFGRRPMVVIAAEHDDGSKLGVTSNPGENRVS